MAGETKEFDYTVEKVGEDLLKITVVREGRPLFGTSVPSPSACSNTNARGSNARRRLLQLS